MPGKMTMCNSYSEMDLNARVDAKLHNGITPACLSMCEKDMLGILIFN